MLKIEKNDVDLTALSASIVAAAPDAVVSYGPDEGIVYIENADDYEAEIVAIVFAHNPAAVPTKKLDKRQRCREKQAASSLEEIRSSPLARDILIGGDTSGYTDAERISEQEKIIRWMWSNLNLPYLEFKKIARG